MLAATRFLTDRLKLGDVVVFTGAGMSTASGLADFRSADKGLWGKWDPMEVATVGCLNENYGQFRDFYQMRLRAIEAVQPNKGHFVLADWEKKGKVTGLITQNVDGLHFAAGSQKVATLHGNLTSIICQDCHHKWEVSDFMNNRACDCGGKLRPDVVLFGERLPPGNLATAEEWSATCKTFVVLGSSLVVSPANMLPALAKKNGAALVIVNAEPTGLDNIADVVVHDSINEYLEGVDEEFKKL